VLDATVSLITTADVKAGADAARRSYDGEVLTLLTVGRLDPEKNPLLLAEVLALLRERDPRWRLVVCGEGDLAGALRARLERMGLSNHFELRGYVPLDGGLLDLYRGSHVFLHVSNTEGLPQVLIEAYASGLPTVATAVGGVRSLADCSVLVEPGAAAAAAAAVQGVAGDSGLRERLIAAGLNRAKGATLEVQTRRVADFLAA
jgi:glycosyltransferase involved in cell wall biosynthesis